MTAFRIGACTSVIANEKPNWLPTSKEGAQDIGLAASTLGTALVNRKIVPMAVRTLVSWYKNEGSSPQINQQLTNIINNNNRQNTQQPNQNTQQPNQNTQQPNQNTEQPNQQTFINELSRFARDPLSFPIIPDHQQSNIQLIYSCQITERKIRYALIPEGCENPEICYERSAIESWLRNTPNTPPKGWPEQIPSLEISVSPAVYISIRLIVLLEILQLNYYPLSKKDKICM